MRICVAGWYFDDELYSSLWRLNSPHTYKEATYPVFIVAHKNSKELHEYDLPYLLHENIGLEWGAYNEYLMRIWDGNDSVLFMHDDIKLFPLVMDNDVVSGELIFNKLAKIEFDHAYIFQNREEDVFNCGRHGRMVYFSERLLKLFKTHGGFLYDHGNKGFVGEGDKPENVLPYNYGIEAISQILKKIQELNPDWTLLKKIYAPSIEMGYRGKFDQEKIDTIKKRLARLVSKEREEIRIG